MITVADYERIGRVKPTLANTIPCPNCRACCHWYPKGNLYECPRCGRGWDVIPELADVKGKPIDYQSGMLRGTVIGEEGDHWKVLVDGYDRLEQLWPKKWCKQ